LARAPSGAVRGLAAGKRERRAQIQQLQESIPACFISFGRWFNLPLALRESLLMKIMALMKMAGRWW
jgi:hypothetical protein